MTVKGGPLTERRDQEERKKFIKDAMKEAFKEYLDEKTRQFGKWSLRTIAILALAALVYFILSMNGWQHVPVPAHATEIPK